MSYLIYDIAVVYIGVDVAKASLDVAWAEHSGRFANNKSGLGALTKWFKQSPLAVHLIFDASCAYERGLSMRPSRMGSKSVWYRPIGCGNISVRLASWRRR